MVDIISNDNQDIFALKEPSLNISSERKYLDTYKYYTEPASKQIDLKDYSVSDSDYIKKLYDDVENTIINKSDSTLEVKPIDYEKMEKYIISAKLEANKIKDVDINAAIDQYKELIYYIDDGTKTLTDNLIDANETLKSIFNQRKLIYSNLALMHMKNKNYKKCIEMDLYIISADRKFEKSYVRLINCYTCLDSLSEANHYANLMKEIFNSQTISKYKEYFDVLERKNDAADQSLKKLSKKSKMMQNSKSEKLNNMDESELNKDVSTVDTGDNTTKSKHNKIKKKDGFINKLFLFFGSTMIIVSSGFLVFLYFNRNNYRKRY